MTTRINNLWRKCKHVELVASVNTRLVSRIHHLYTSNQPTNNAKKPAKLLYPVYNTHALDNEWEGICKMIHNSVQTIPGIDLVSVRIAEDQSNYKCIIVEFTIPKYFLEDYPNERA